MTFYKKDDFARHKEVIDKFLDKNYGSFYRSMLRGKNEWCLYSYNTRTSETDSLRIVTSSSGNYFSDLDRYLGDVVRAKFFSRTELPEFRKLVKDRYGEVIPAKTFDKAISETKFRGFELELNLLFNKGKKLPLHLQILQVRFDKDSFSMFYKGNHEIGETFPYHSIMETNKTKKYYIDRVKEAVVDAIARTANEFYPDNQLVLGRYKPYKIYEAEYHNNINITEIVDFVKTHPTSFLYVKDNGSLTVNACKFDILSRKEGTLKLSRMEKLVVDAPLLDNSNIEFISTVLKKAAKERFVEDFSSQSLIERAVSVIKPFDFNPKKNITVKEAVLLNLNNVDLNFTP